MISCLKIENTETAWRYDQEKVDNDILSRQLTKGKNANTAIPVPIPQVQNPVIGEL